MAFQILLFRNYSVQKKMGCQESQISLSTLDAQIPQKQMKRQRRKIKNDGVFGKPSIVPILENIKKVDRPKTMADFEFIERIISKHFLLFKLSKQERRQLAIVMEAYQTDMGEVVFEQGTLASLFFIIEEGEVQIQINGSPIKTMKKGDYFGELSIIYSSTRSASVKALSKCSFWCLSQQIFLQVQREMVKNNFKMAKTYVCKLPIFNCLTAKQKDAISFNMNTLKYDETQIVFKEGEDAMCFYIIVEGMIQIDIPGKPAVQVKKGQSFGQNCLRPNQIRSGTAKCLQKSKLLAISREDLKFCLGEKSQSELLFNNLIKWALHRSKLFKQNTSYQQSKLISMGHIQFRLHEQTLAQVGEKDQNIYICLEGKINCYEIGQLINEKEAAGDNQIFISKETLVKKGNGYIFKIAIKNIQGFKNKEKNKIRQSLLRYSKNQCFSKNSIPSLLKIDFSDLYILSKLGQGQMGKVFLVQNKKTFKRYALKCIEKNFVIKNQMERFLIAQKQILSICNFPLISKLVQSYKDSHFVYLLLEYIEGGDFFDCLSEIGVCSNNQARFYFACILLSIQYFHKKSIVYRDVKPQNVAVGADGYLHMIDMGTAKLLEQNSQTGYRTFTIIGTPHYMAPEVMQAKGYSFSVDIWSLGVILYEMVCGFLPFGSHSDDPVRIYKQIQQHELRFPKNYTHQAGKELIQRLLQKHPDNRAVEDFSELKNMVFFQQINWKLLETRKIVAPVIPKINDLKGNIKSQYLLSYLEKEKLKLERPLPPQNEKWDQIF